MASTYHWQIWCETEDTWVYAWSTTKPTECPNNPAHTITASKTSIIDHAIEDSLTSKRGPFLWMQVMLHRREIYNDTENELYHSSVTPILGEDGHLQDHADRILNLENIHAKLGWHNQQLLEQGYSRPDGLLIYYGWPNAYNSALNGWNNENVAQDMARFRLIVLGDGVQTIYDDGTHDGGDSQSTLTDSSKSWTVNEWVGNWINNVTKGTAAQVTANTATTITAAGMTWDDDDVYRIADHQDYVNLIKIVPRVQLLNPNTKVFGYVSTDQDLSAFQGKTDDWDVVQVDGIFMDESGYDFGKTRAEFNTRVDYVHGKTYASLCFANAWNTDHILGTADDGPYPNSTYNNPLTESHLTINDWILLESFAVNTSAYTTPADYEPRTQWETRVNKMIGLRATYGVNFAGVAVIGDAEGSGQAMFDFAFTAAMMASLEGFGSSDESYGASDSQVKYWTRPNTSRVGRTWTLNPSIQNSGNIDMRYAEKAKYWLDFTTSSEDSGIDQL